LGVEFSEMDPNFLNFVQYYQTVFNTSFQGGEKKFKGSFAPLAPDCTQKNDV